VSTTIGYKVKLGTHPIIMDDGFGLLNHLQKVVVAQSSSCLSVCLSPFWHKNPCSACSAACSASSASVCVVCGVYFLVYCVKQNKYVCGYICTPGCMYTHLFTIFKKTTDFCFIQIFKQTNKQRKKKLAGKLSKYYYYLLLLLL